MYIRSIARFFQKTVVSIAIRSLLTSLAFAWTLRLSPQSGDTLLIALPLAFLFSYAQGKQTVRCFSISFVLALFQTAVHYQNYPIGAEAYPDSPTLLAVIASCKFLLSFAGWYVFFHTLLGLLFAFLNRFTLAAPQKRTSIKRLFLLSMLVLLLCRIPMFLACFPAAFSSDTLNQFQQLFGIIPATGQHPLAHTYLLKLGYDIGYGLFGTANAGAAVCSGFQLLFMTSVEALAIAWLCRQNVKTGYLYGCIAFFALLPFHAVWSVTLVKDIPFAGFLLLFTLMLGMMQDAQRLQGLRKCLFFAAFTIVSMAVCLLRNAAVLIYLASFIAVLIHIKKLRAVLLLSCVVTLLVTVAISAQTPHSPIVHTLSMPIQHIARVVADGKELKPEEEKLLNEVVELKKIPETYTAWLSDPMKTLADSKTGSDQYIREHKAEFLKLWLHLGMRYPLEYIKAQIDQTAGYLSPQEYWASSMQPDIINTGEFYRDPLVPSIIFKFFSAIERAYKIIPIYGLLSSAGFYVWLLLALFAYAIIRKAPLVPFAPALSLWCYCLLASPVFSEFRYVYPIIICVPLLLGVTLRQAPPVGEAVQALP